MKYFLLHIVLSGLSLAVPAQLSAQDSPGVKAIADKKAILVGEPIQLTIQARIPEGMPRQWPALDTIPHFDIISKTDLDSSYEAGTMVYRQQITLTSFDSGSQVIPQIPVVVNNRKYLTDSLQVEVGYSNLDPRQDYHDIKDIIDVQNPDVKYVLWGLLLLTLGAAAGAIYYLRQKAVAARFSRAENGVRLSPFEEAMQALEELRKKQLTRNGQTKLYYSGLNDILRVFVHRKLDIASMEKTNEELVAQLRKMEISPEKHAQLAEALRMSDSVKFAKYQPDETRNEANFGIIESSIRILDEISAT